MIVCSCNVLSDRDIRNAVAAERTRSISRLYGGLGCRARCGRCARTIRRLTDETLGAVQAPGCDSVHEPCGGLAVRRGGPDRASPETG